jgi:hypothetical protein
MNRNTIDMLRRLESAGVEWNDAESLRRISMTLHAWHEGECGNYYGCIERDEETGKTYNVNAYSGKRYPTPDRETGALKRLATLMAKYPSLSYYVQGDPRGASLYILRAGDIPEGKDVDAYYNRGIAVYK